MYLPTVWFRNTWSWGYDDYSPSIKAASDGDLAIEHKSLGNLHFYTEGNPETLFTNNETNTKRLYNFDDGRQFYKDGINDYVIYSNSAAVNPEKKGTKAAAIMT
jgi:hypothetical protein